MRQKPPLPSDHPKHSRSPYNPETATGDAAMAVHGGSGSEQSQDLEYSGSDRAVDTA